MESNFFVLQKMPHIFLLLFIHIATVVYYTHAYLQEQHDGIYDERTKWYQHHKKYLSIRQIVFTCICIWLGFIKMDLMNAFLKSSLWLKLILCFSFFISIVYYLPKRPLFSLQSFRHIGILKSLSIAWVWTIICYVFPIWFELRENFTSLLDNPIFWFHFTFLFLFILILSILFDIKDLYRDQKEMVKTIVAQHGINYTLKKVIAPLLLFNSLLTIIGYIKHYFSIGEIIINLLTLGLTYIVAKNINNYKTIHCNLLMIDGLMIIKALLSIVLWIFFLKS